ncbi:MAG: hypothetical protein HYX72_12805 [Acidobacteria bacterium]|nr:hypothetical protein [Acidobacteriota bacterium]
MSRKHPTVEELNRKRENIAKQRGIVRISIEDIMEARAYKHGFDAARVSGASAVSAFRIAKGRTRRGD